MTIVLGGLRNSDSSLPVAEHGAVMSNLTVADASPVDVLIVGVGVAGLGAALTLAPARRSVLVVDTGQPPDAPAAS